MLEQCRKTSTETSLFLRAGSNRLRWQRVYASSPERPDGPSSQHSGGRLRFTDDQRRRLAVKGRVLGRRALDGIAGLVTPDTTLRWYRELIAAKYDGAARRGAGRPETAAPPATYTLGRSLQRPAAGRSAPSAFWHLTGTSSPDYGIVGRVGFEMP
jgi:hypothetical protein